MSCAKLPSCHITDVTPCDRLYSYVYSADFVVINASVSVHMDDTLAVRIKSVLSIGGRVLRPMRLDLDALRGFESVTLEPFDRRCFTTGKFIRRIGAYSGVPLRALLDAAGVRRSGETNFKRTVFLARGHDGYAVTASWHELFNTPIGERTLIAYACDDWPLDVDNGLPVLVAGADMVRAPRHVKRLASVDAILLE